MKKHRSSDLDASFASQDVSHAAGKRARTEALVQQKRDAGAAGAPPPVLAMQPQSEGAPVRSDQSFLESIVGPAVQTKAVKDDAEGVHELAAEGVAGAGESLPFLDQIQRSFGDHDLSGVRAHTDGAAGMAASGMGAEAFATGNDVAFKGSPDLHTAAHEAAHVVQQRGGVQLKGGVGAAGDEYERNADAVADRVVAGQSAADLLGAAPAGAGSSAIQMRGKKKGSEKKPSIEVSEKVVAGKKGGGAGPASMKPGDTFVVKLKFKGVENPREHEGDIMPVLAHAGDFVADIAGKKISDDEPFQLKETRWDGDVMNVSVYAHHAGAAHLGILGELSDELSIEKHWSLKCESSMAYFKDRCDIATNRHRALVALADSWLHSAAISYKTGYDNYFNTLEALKKKRALRDEILLGILFAGVGGAVGGAVGGLFKSTAGQVAAGVKVRKSIQNAIEGVITDAPKDIAKYTARLPPKISKGIDANTSETPSSEEDAKLPADTSPFTWYADINKALSLETAKVAAVIEGWQTAALDGMQQGLDEKFDWDPVNAITSITALGGTLVTDLPAVPPSEQYEKNMWEAWIDEHGTYVYGGHITGYGIGQDKDDDVTGAMARVAKKLKDMGIEANADWIDAAWKAARDRRQPAVDKANKEDVMEFPPGSL